MNQTECLGSMNQTVYVPIFIVGLILNSVVLWVLAFKIRKLTESTIYMTNLIVADFFLLVTIPFKIYAYMDKVTMNTWGCRFLESLYFVNIHASILITTAVCVDRYIAIKRIFDTKKLRSQKKAAITCGAIWITVWLATLHIYLNSGYDKCDRNVTCFHNVPDKFWNLGIIVPVEVIFLICTAIVSFCSLQIIRTLQSSLTESETKLKKKAIKIVLSSLVVFLICFIPHHISVLLFTLNVNNLMEQYSREDLGAILQISLCVANVNCCLDAVYYYFAIKEMQKQNERGEESLTVCTKLQGTIGAAVDCPDIQLN
uniref:G-protein coupled receptors family 1 profile domain-containing protein n=1 Tax=Callorhinchus milii TaxID=7868 RepID=A0A4W3JAK5_CALMI